MTSTPTTAASSKTTMVPFVLLELSLLAAVAGGSMVYIAMPWIIFDLTGSATAAGAVVAISSIPGLFLSPILGTLIDRIGRRKAMIYGDILAGIAICLIPISDAIYGLNFWLLVVLAVVRSIFAPSSFSARKALVPDVAKAANMPLERANSIHEAIFGAGFAAGPAVAAVLIAWVGVVNVFWFVGVVGLVAAGLALLINVHEDRGELEGRSETGSLLADTVLGFKAILKAPAVLVMMTAIMALALVYLPSEMVVLPAHYNAIQDSQSLGLIISAMAIGGSVGALGFDVLRRFLSYANILRLGMIMVALSMLPMAFLLPTFWMVVFGFSLGLFWGPMMPLLNTVIQNSIDASMRGRVFGLEMTIWNLAPMISMMLAGIAVDAFGVGGVYLSLALFVLVGAVVISSLRVTRQIR